MYAGSAQQFDATHKNWGQMVGLQSILPQTQ
jgi:hypothetical protein